MCAHTMTGHTIECVAVSSRMENDFGKETAEQTVENST